MKKTTIPLIIFLTVALVGGLMLVKQNQETRKGASFANTKLMLLPSEKIIKAVGEVVPVKVYYQTESGAKVDGVQAVICYGDELTLNADTGVVGNTENGFEAEPIVSIKDGCATLVTASKKAADQLKTTGEAFAISFVAAKAGEGNLTIDQSKSMVTGDNAASATDKEIAITGVENTTYQITGGGSGNCNRCSVLFDYMRTAWTAEDCSLDPVGLTITRTYDATCMAPADTRKPLQCSRCSVINDKEYVWWERAEDKTCADNPATGATVYRAPREDCSISGVVTSPILNMKGSFGNVKVADGKCAVNWPLQVIVLSNGDTKVYTNVIGNLVTSTGGLNMYQGSLPLVGFNHLTDVAVFVKGPKHLQMKYAIQNQTGPYDKAGGELTLTTSAETSPLYDFTGYPMLAGDVVGATVNDGPNGEINGVDFAYVKSRSLLHTTVAEGGYLKADLDGNCQEASNDVTVLKLSLEKKQGELY
ncbi:MAG: hypothetical protein US68_C0005G0002 [Candidatus Shapirobacteria bacterium GW2011_GWE1_38_10]|uniref:Cohesin domain-containing protein n=1 Tax=Candidatus Shapirobacteria bacterium GW2011_GWE1_38_10 TaxID=1618488 RepID=A0A0G0IHE9_9BACT|nr:MAG: hypothetical protein US46_C0009G0018 [Candidatus Shapirobacteria bacterium GW2011_GWF2_37_20]KKQ50435.1 MAG: hypothetical protein US68_C0005G0002 [Candidatus Shapirobacteria bacterium GW2011_GWE1_38_10]KKQ65091.1 MAG: hypothetical protein US85_C0001G0018 [Candidatus Shapirobacteria bacterium GW2011_GWF1_38_23]HBP50848.1 hypothetical protein [Candidatus Shapirobacteria bacterium]